MSEPLYWTKLEKCFLAAQTNCQAFSSLFELNRALPDFQRFSLFQPYILLTKRRIVLAILLSLLFHSLVLFLFHIRPSNSKSIPQRILDVSFEVSTSNSPPPPDKPAKPAKPARIIAAPSVPSATVTSPPIIETTTQVTPVTTAPPVEASQSVPTPTEKIESISSLTRIPGPLRKIEATYPASERRAGIQAYVLAEVVIDAQGKVQNVRIIKSGGKAFDTTVIDALNNSAFSPGYIGDKAVSVRISIPFRFSLN